MKNIALIGMTGCGKTAFGKALARRIKYKFYDVDLEIEKQKSMKTTDIFTKYGETYFRQIESEMIAALSELEGVVISTGGGAVLTEENTINLKKNGIVIFINRPIEQIKESIDVNERPLLKDGLNKLDEMLEKRLPLYLRYCDYEVKNDKSFIGTLRKLSKIGRTL